MNNLLEMQEFWWKFSFYFWKIFCWENIVEEKNVTYFWRVKYTLHVIYFWHVTYFLHRCEICCITKNFFDVQWFSYRKKFEKTCAVFPTFPKTCMAMGQRGVGGVFGWLRNFSIIAIFWVFDVWVLFDIYVAVDKFFCV